MPTTEANIEQVQKAREKAAKSTTSGKSLQSTATGLGDILMEAVRGDRATRGVSKLATDTGNVMGQLVSDPANIRQFGSTEGTRMDPLAVDAATSDQRARNLRTLGTVSTQKAQNEGTLQEVIQAGANQMKALAEQKFAEAQQYKSEADALMERLAYEMEVRKQDFAESQSGGSGGDGGMGALIAALMGQEQFVPQEGGYTPVPDGFIPDEPNAPVTQQLAGAGEYISNKLEPLQRGTSDVLQGMFPGVSIPAKAFARFIKRLTRNNKVGGSK